MSDVTKAEREFMRHALGLSKQKTGYRNYYSAGGSDIAIGRALAAKGMAVEAQPNAVHPDPLFWITREGFEAVKKAGEKMDAEEVAKFAHIAQYRASND